MVERPKYAITKLVARVQRKHINSNNNTNRNSSDNNSNGSNSNYNSNNNRIILIILQNLYGATFNIMENQMDNKMETLRVPLKGIWVYSGIIVSCSVFFSV